MAAKRWKRCFWTSHAGAAKPVRPRNERVFNRCSDVGAASRRRDGVALSLSLALVLDAASGAHLLAGGAAPGVGSSAVLHRPEFRFFRPRQRGVHRRRAVVGRAFPRPPRLLVIFSGGEWVSHLYHCEDRSP